MVGVLPIARNVATNLPFVMRAASANTVERSSAGRWLRTPYRHKQISTLQSGSGIGSRISPTSNRRVTPARLANSCDRTRARRTCVSARSTPRAVIRHFSRPVDNAPNPSAWAAAQLKHGEFAPASRAQLVQCVSQNSPDFLIPIGVLPVELIKLVDIAIGVGPVAFTGAVIIQTDVGARGSGNVANKGSHGTVLSRRVIQSSAKSGRESMLMSFCEAPLCEAPAEKRCDQC